MKRTAALLLSLVVSTAAAVACGSGSASPSDASPDSGSGITIPSSPTCGSGVNEYGACTADDSCCVVVAPDSFGPDGYRCSGGTWRRDTACVPVPVCAAPLSGTLSLPGGAPMAVTCLSPIGVYGAVGVSLTVGGARLELVFDQLPLTGEVVEVISGARPAPLVDAGADADAGDAGRTPTHAGFRIGYPGGIAGFSVLGGSVSGTITIASITTGPSGLVTSLHASIDAQTKGESSADWSGNLTGSW
jgi:hypothetical protein